MTTQELNDWYQSLYDYMVQSKNPANMMHFGKVMTQMMDWMIANRPETAQEYIGQLEVIKWKNYLTPKEADKIISGMEPKAPWSMEQWKGAMLQRELPLEEEPCYNKCALFVTMSMIYSDSIDTLKKFAGSSDVFEIINELAKDKLKDKDGVFNVRKYFGL